MSSIHHPSLLLLALLVAIPPASPTALAGQDYSNDGGDHILLDSPGEVVWQPGPGSLPEGAELAVIEGDPGAEGIFMMRLRLPDGYTIAPHHHPAVERVTVLEGTFNLGMGEEVDPQAFVPLEPGAFFAIQPGHRHFARAEGRTVIQLTGEGPWELIYVNPEDDPRGAGR